MSQSPIDEFSERATLRYRQGWKALNRLLHEDRSFSGHERNCVFLNTGASDGTERFADVSAASGFDFPDDGRAVALCDWDFDGDLDVWVTNRNAPRVRFLRNNSPPKNHYVAIKLQGDGQRTNRDAVGARVELILEGDDARPLIRTLTAGDGFLSQTSGWLHFGLGSAQRIRQVVVRWPGGDVATYDQIDINSRYLIDQASGQVTPWLPPTTRKPLVASSQQPLTSNGVTRTVLPSPRLLPTLPVEGQDAPLNDMVKGPTVISIWSSTCTSCVQELQEYANQAERLRQAGLNVVAVNLDHLEGDAGPSDEILKGIRFPFTAVSGTTELVRSLEVFKQAVFDRWQTLAVPTSLLVDDRGFVICIYQGPVAIDQLLADRGLLRHLSLQSRRQECTPFEGHWIMPPVSADPLDVVSKFVDEAMVGSGIEYLERHVRLVEQEEASSQALPTTLPESENKGPGDLYYVLAVILREQQQTDASSNAFQKAISYRPDDLRFRNDYANLLAELGKLPEAAEQLEQAKRMNPQETSVQRKLAMVYVALGKSAAAIEQFQSLLEVEPKDVASWYNLANSYRVVGQWEKALDAYRRTLEIEPKMALAANNLAWILATHPQDSLRNGKEAVRWATQVCQQTNHKQPSFLDTLACAYAENGEFDKAIDTAEVAIQLFNQSKKTDAAARIQARIELFRSQRPFRDPVR